MPTSISWMREAKVYCTTLWGKWACGPSLIFPRLGRSDIVDTLLRACPNLNIKGEDGHTPYELAIQVYEAPEHKTIARNLEKYSELFEWLEKNQLSNFRSFFIKNSLNLDNVTKLTERDLTEMGITKLADREVIMKSLATLSQSMSTTYTTNWLTVKVRRKLYPRPSLLQKVARNRVHLLRIRVHLRVQV